MKKVIVSLAIVFFCGVTCLAEQIPPKIKVDFPPDKFETNQRELEVKGTVENAIRLNVNGEFVTVQPNGSFIQNVKLNDGQNLINLAAYNVNSSSQLDLMVIRHDSLSQVDNTKSIAYSITYPANNLKTFKDMILLKAKVKNADKVYVNDEEVKIESGKIFKKVTLRIGQNSVNVKFVNEKQTVNSVLTVYRLSGKEEGAKSSDGTTIRDGSSDDISSTKMEEFSDKLDNLEKKVNKMPKKNYEESSDLFKGLPPVTLKLQNADIKDVLAIIKEQSGLNIITDPALEGKLNIDLDKVDVVKALDYILRIHGYAYMIVGDTLIIGTKETVAKAYMFEPKIFRMVNSKAADGAAAINNLLSEEEKVVVSAEENSIVAYAYPNTLKKIEVTLKDMDRIMSKQVFIEAKVLEVGTNVIKRFGFDWSDQTLIMVERIEEKSAEAEGTGGTAAAATEKKGFVPGEPIKLPISLTEVAFNHLQSDADSKIIASPKISAIHGKKATIEVGDNYPIFTTSVDKENNTYTTSVSYQPVGIKLMITPYINIADNTVRLVVSTEVSFIYSFVGQSQQTPWIRTRRAETEIRAKDGQTFIIGGLINNEDRVSKKQVPVLGDLPIIGALFTMDTNEKVETELLIAITPRITN